LLELDGRCYHDEERRFRDWRRDNLSSEDGWLKLGYGWHDTVIESCQTAGNLVRALRRRGFDGELGRCSAHCSVRVCPFSRCRENGHTLASCSAPIGLLVGDGGASGLEGLASLVCSLLVDLLQNGLGGGLDQVLSLLEPKAGE
jgi:hypothetical protein